ncbi:hypothetical protein JYK21_07300 [Ralstonia pickettii]|nr:hypothetical protein [Ralstonia pickettii]
MEKVILTKEQADAVEYFKKEHQDNLGDMSLRGFYDALRYGYEVEPKFKVRDWITYDEDKYGSGDKEVVWIEEIKYSNYWNEECAYWNAGDSSLPLSKIRHATPSEIAKEKERRFFARHGRGPWELKVNDVLSFKESNITYNVEQIDYLITISKGESSVNYRLDQVKKLFKVACFAENRLDV